MDLDLQDVEFRILEVPDYPRYSIPINTGWKEHLRIRSEDRGKYSGVTLGAYRRGKSPPSAPGLYGMWLACARQEMVTGVPWPHCYFISYSRGDGSIHCPQCRAEIAANPRAPIPPKIRKPTNQMSLF